MHKVFWNDPDQNFSYKNPHQTLKYDVVCTGYILDNQKGTVFMWVYCHIK